MYLCILGAQKYFPEQLPPVLPGLALGSCDCEKEEGYVMKANSVQKHTCDLIKWIYY